MSKHRKKTQKRATHPSPRDYVSVGSQYQTLVRATVHGSGNYTSSAGGVIAANISLDPSALGSTDWADFSSTYDEFRVIGARVIFAPVQFGVAVNGGLVAIAFDNDSGGSPASLTEVQQYSTCRYFMVNGFTKIQTFTWWRPVKGKETTIIWDDVANPSTSIGSIRLYSSLLSANTNYLQFAVELFCEFRGRR